MLRLCGRVGCSPATASGGYSHRSARASDYGDFSCWGAWAIGHEHFRSCGSYRFNSCGYGLSCSEACQPGSGIKSISPGRLTGRFFTTEPPEKPCSEVILMEIIHTLFFFFLCTLFLKRVLVSQQNWEEDTETSAPTHGASLNINSPHQDGIIATTDEGTLPHHLHPNT